jgi:heptosyltransferase III
MPEVAPSAKVKPVVIYRLGSLGDTIVALPCFHAIARAFPNNKRLVLTNIPVSSKAAPLEGILGGSGLIDGTISYPVGTRSVSALWALRKQLRALGADTLVYLTPPRGLAAAWRDVIFFKLCGFKHIIGAPLSAALQSNRLLNDEGLLEHEALRLARCLAPSLDVQPNAPDSWQLNFTASEEQRGSEVIAAFQLNPFIAINMGGKLLKNDWGESNWHALLSKISEHWPALGLLIVGATEDAERARKVQALWSGVVVNSCGKLTPRESARAMKEAVLFVGHDSGPMHLASAMGVACIGLFGDNNPPGKWHPFGLRHTPIHRMNGVQTIQVHEVQQAFEHTMAKYFPSMHA